MQSVSRSSFQQNRISYRVQMLHTNYDVTHCSILAGRLAFTKVLHLHVSHPGHACWVFLVKESKCTGYSFVD